MIYIVNWIKQKPDPSNNESKPNIFETKTKSNGAIKNTACAADEDGNDWRKDDARVS